MKKNYLLFFFVAIFLNCLGQNNKTANNIAEITIKVENTLTISRKEEIIELDWTKLSQKNEQIGRAHV